MAVIKAENLSKEVSLGNQTLSILSALNLEVNARESLAIIGRSGSGKSTLLSLLAGLDSATSGKIALNGNELTKLDEDGRAAVRNQHVGFIFQSFQLLPHLTALDNVMLPLELAGDKQAQRKAEAWLDKVGLGGRMHHQPNQLSGGEQQRVAIARAFVTEPEILFADEPTGNLDPTTGQNIVDLLFELNAEHGTTLVLVTHDHQLAHLCQRYVILENGALIEGQAEDTVSPQNSSLVRNG
ncbi:ABC transporter ATP-binding protein [Litoribacillus peritrichatus]|uniref:ABC transporter ATP-binding protein n=1 Tax=Litoribacillus peritrichatus TaxID=718191 RepID=A0ABP7NAG7_9GAMM